jgi:hypothetical protein
MADSQLTVQPGAEFQALPLEFIIAAPLTGVIKAQAIAASTTKDFVEALKDEVVDFSYQVEGDAKREATLKAPLLAVVPVPHLRIDSYTSTFRYEISQVVSEKDQLDKGASLEAGTTGLLSNFVSATVKGSVTSHHASESTANRSGSLEITVHASEAEIPKGLALVLSHLARAIPPLPPLAEDKQKK